VIYVCENNGWAEFSPIKIHMLNEDIAARAAVYNMSAESVANDVFDIYEAAERAVKRARQGDGPTLLEVKCNRWYGHFVGDGQRYRGKEAVQEAMSDDCLKRFEDDLLNQKVITKKSMAAIEQQIKDEIAAAVDFARNSPAPEASELAQGLYV